MHQSASNLLSQSSVKQKRLSLGVYCPPKELLNHSARNNYQSTPESSSHSQLTTTNLTTRKANIPPSIYGISPAQVATPSITTDHLMLNRKLTKGYSKFLEEKGFISRRDEERQKVQEDIRRSLANDSQKVISTEIQKLITSTIVNESIKKPRAVLRSTDSNINNGELGKYDEKHKQVCNRILGGSFENNFLFMKVQKENTLLPIPPSYKKFPKKPNTINKACSFSGVNHINDYSMSARTEPRIKKSASGVLPPSLTDLGKDKSDKNRERKLTADDLESKVPSLTVIGPESVKGNDDVETLNDFQFQTVIFSQTQICEGSENDKKLTKSSSSARSRKYLNDTNSGSLRDLSAKLEETNKRLRGNAFEATLYKNIENKKQFKKAGRRYQSFTEENLETQNKMTPKLSSIKGSISKINELCDGAIRSTSILGHKLRQQHVRTGKDFVNLDILVEKLTYENTIQNWEKSVKQVENMESRNFFSNMA